MNHVFPVSLTSDRRTMQPMDRPPRLSVTPSSQTAHHPSIEGSRTTIYQLAVGRTVLYNSNWGTLHLLDWSREVWDLRTVGALALLVGLWALMIASVMSASWNKYPWRRIIRPRIWRDRFVLGYWIFLRLFTLVATWFLLPLVRLLIDSVG